MVRKNFWGSIINPITLGCYCRHHKVPAAWSYPEAATTASTRFRRHIITLRCLSPASKRFRRAISNNYPGVATLASTSLQTRGKSGSGSD